MRVEKKEGFPRLALCAHHYHDRFSLLYRNIHAAFKPFLPQETHKDYGEEKLNPLSSDPQSNCLLASLAGANPNDLFDCGDKNLTVANLAGFSSANYGFNCTLNQ